MVLAVLASPSMADTGIASANEYSCAHAAANGYVRDSKFFWQVERDCAVAYKIAYPGGIDNQAQSQAAVDAANQYLRSLGYDAATVEQMDIAGHGVYFSACSAEVPGG